MPLTTRDRLTLSAGLGGFGCLGMIVIVSLVVILTGGGGCRFDLLGVSPGPRGVVILHESADKTPTFARLVTGLRTPPASDYLKEKSHTLDILDDDSEGPDGKPAPSVEAWKAVAGSMPLPVLIIYESKSRKILDKQSLAKDATVDTILAALKAKGG